MRMNPDWQFWLWTDDDNRELIRRHYPFFLGVYDGYEFFKRVDAVRVFYMHRYGGLYMDLDFACLQPMESVPMAPGEAVFSYQYGDHVITTKPGAIANNFMASPPRHPFFEYAILILPTRQTSTLLVATGPRFLTATIKGFRVEHRRQDWITVHHMPTIYSTSWRGRNPCGRGSAEELKGCRRSVVVNRSLFTTFWTATWKRPLPPPQPPPSARAPTGSASFGTKT